MSAAQPAQPSGTPGDPGRSPGDALAALDPDFLALFACPRCADRPPVRIGDDQASLVCDRCGRVYPITDGFPDLRLTEEEIAALREPAAGSGNSGDSSAPPRID